MRWTEGEVEELRKLYPQSEASKIMSWFNRSWDAIAAKALRTGLKREVRVNLGSKNGQWRGGVNEDYYRRIAFENLPKRCAICEAKDRLEVHHKDKNRKNNELSNLMILCTQCHKNVHAEMNGWSMDHDACIICQRTDRKHNAHGMCNACYSRVLHRKKMGYEGTGKPRKSKQQRGNPKNMRGTRRTKNSK